MPRLRIKVPSIIEGGPSYERELWLALATDDENEGAILMNAPRLDHTQAPVVLCYGNAGTLSSCMRLLTEEFSKGDPVTNRLLGLPLIDMESRHNFIGKNSVVTYLLSLGRFRQMDAAARAGLWEDLLVRDALHATGDIVLDPVRIITPRKMPV